MKLKFILALLMPLLQSAVVLLRNKDENTTGADDEAAAAIEFALGRLQKYLV